jgi:hypothetical protein
MTQTVENARSANPGQVGARGGILADHDIYQLDARLTTEERAIRDKVRAFVNDEVLPVINDYWERAEFPFELVEKLAELKVAGTVIKGFGCPGMSRMASAQVSVELARGDGSVSTFFGVHSGLAMGSIDALGSEEQKERWRRPWPDWNGSEPSPLPSLITARTRSPLRRVPDAKVIPG